MCDTQKKIPQKEHQEATGRLWSASAPLWVHHRTNQFILEPFYNVNSLVLPYQLLGSALFVYYSGIVVASQ